MLASPRNCPQVDFGRSLGKLWAIEESVVSEHEHVALLSLTSKSSNSGGRVRSLSEPRPRGQKRGVDDRAESRRQQLEHRDVQPLDVLRNKSKVPEESYFL